MQEGNDYEDEFEDEFEDDFEDDEVRVSASFHGPVSDLA